MGSDEEQGGMGGKDGEEQTTVLAKPIDFSPFLLDRSPYLSIPGHTSYGEEAKKFSKNYDFSLDKGLLFCWGGLGYKELFRGTVTQVFLFFLFFVFKSSFFDHIVIIITTKHNQITIQRSPVVEIMCFF